MEQRNASEAVARQKEGGGAEVTRAKILLTCAEGRANTEATKMFGVS